MIKLFASDENTVGIPEHLKPITDIVKNLCFQYKANIDGLGVSVEYNWRNTNKPQVERLGNFEAGWANDPNDEKQVKKQFSIVLLEKRWISAECCLGLDTDEFCSIDFEVRYTPHPLFDDSETYAKEFILELKNNIKRCYADSSSHVCLTDYKIYPEIDRVFRSWDY